MAVAKQFWFSKCTVTRRTQNGIDPDTRLPKYTTTTLLENEPCDLRVDSRRAVTPVEPSGIRIDRLRETQLRLEINDRTLIPDENDDIVVDGIRFKMQAVITTDVDPVTNRLLGVVLALTTPEVIP